MDKTEEYSKDAMTEGQSSLGKDSKPEEEIARDGFSGKEKSNGEKSTKEMKIKESIKEKKVDSDGTGKKKRSEEKTETGESGKKAKAGKKSLGAWFRTHKKEKDESDGKIYKYKNGIKKAIFAEIVFMLLFTICIVILQIFLALMTFSNDIKRSEKHIKDSYRDALEEGGQALRSIDELCFGQVGICTEISRLLGEEDLDMVWIKNYFKLDNYYILDREGNVKETSNPEPVDFHQGDLVRLYSYDPDDNYYYNNAVIRQGTDGKKHRCYSSIYQESYETWKNNEDIIVFEMDHPIVKMIEEETTSMETLLKNESVGYDGFAFAVDRETGEFVYKPEKMEGGSTGIPADKLADLKKYSASIFSMDDNIYIVKAVNVNEDVLVCLTITIQEIWHTILMSSFGVVLVFFVISSLIVTYAVLLEEDYLRKKNKGSWKPILKGWIYYNRSIGEKILLFSVIGLIIMAMTTVYFQTLLVLSRRSQNTMAIASDAVSSVKKKKEYSNDVKDAGEIIELETFLFMTDALNKYDKIDNQILKTILKSSNIKAATIYDADMNEILYTTSNYIPREIKKLEGTDLLDTVHREIELYGYYVGDPFVMVTPENEIMNLQYFGWEDTMKNGTGYVFFCLFETDFVKTIQDSTILKSVLSKIETGDGGRAWSVSKEDRTISYFPNSAVIGKKISKYGLKKSQLENDYNGYIRMNGKIYYAAVKETDDNYIFVTVPWRNIMSDRLPMLVVTLLSAFLVFFLLYLRIAFERDVGVRVYIYSDRKRNETAESIIIKLMKCDLVVAAACVCILELVAYNFLEDDNIIKYIFYGNWNKGLNIFSLTQCIVTICKGVIVISFLIWMLRSLESIFSSAGSTVCRLLASLLKYVGVLVIAFMSIASFGVDPTTLVASFGILTTVIGLGANSLLQDIFAGLFIIFEGDLRVNDEVLLGDSRAKIVEIGIRTTKFRDRYNNTRIINNKNIIDITTRSKGAHRLFYNLKIDKSISSSQVEEVLDSALAYLKNRYPEYVMDVENRGIILGAENYMQYRFVVRTKERLKDKTDAMVREEVGGILEESAIPVLEWL